MTCADCLSALATESLRDISPDSPILQHCATCPDCARLTTTLRENEYEAATLFNSLPPMSNPLTVAETAVRIAQRRRVGRVVVMVSGAALAATIWIAAATTIIPALNRRSIAGVQTGPLGTETISLTCLSPKQAADIISPYVRSHGSAYYIPGSGISAITVRGTRSEILKSRDLIVEFEQDPGAACRLPTLLGKPGEPLLDLKTPTGTGPMIPPERATTAPKKQ